MNQIARGIARWAVGVWTDDEDFLGHVGVLELTPELRHDLKEMAFLLQSLLSERRVPMEIAAVS